MNFFTFFSKAYKYYKYNMCIKRQMGRFKCNHHVSKGYRFTLLANFAELSSLVSLWVSDYVSVLYAAGLY